MTDDTDTRPLPTMADPQGELVKLITAEDLLRAAGLDAAELGGAEIADLAGFTDNAGHLVAIAKEATETVGGELVRRLDRRGRWTLREAGYVINAPSPAAGTTKYDTDALLQALRDLVKLDAIDQAGADAALEPVPGTVTVDAAYLQAVHERLLELQQLEGAEHVTAATSDALLATTELLARMPATTYRQKPGGIQALLKLGGDIAERLQLAQRTVEPPPRKAKVTIAPRKDD